jgi:bifunctional non-homologous end joining protein LigD
VRLWSRNGRDWSREFTAIAEAIGALPARELVTMARLAPIGAADFHNLKGEEGGANACLFALDLLWLDGEDLRRMSLEERRARLNSELRRARPSLRAVEYLDGDGSTTFEHACWLRLEGLVSNRRDLPYRSGRCASWVKIKNPGYERQRHLRVPG